MTSFVVVVQWLHVIAALLWVGGSAALDLLLLPAIATLPLSQQHMLGRRLVARATIFFALTGTATILLGIVRGTVLGPIQSFRSLNTGYGACWLVALLLTSGLAWWGARVIGPSAARLYGSMAEAGTSTTGPGPAVVAATQHRLAIYTRAQLIGFAGVLLCMTLMAEVLS